MKKPTGSRFLIKAALKKTIQEMISRLDSPTVAHQLEAETHRARKGGIFDDKTTQEMLDNIALIRKEQGWS